MNLKGQQRVCDYCYKIETKRLYWNSKVPLLQQGAIVQSVGRFSSDSRMIKLSDNQQTIEILDPNSKKIKDSWENTISLYVEYSTLHVSTNQPTNHLPV